MILILGLIILALAVIVGLAGVFGNIGAGHGLGTGGDFSVFGYHATSSTGSLFLSGIIVGAVGVLGLALVAIGVRRSARRSARPRRVPRMSRSKSSEQKWGPISGRCPVRAIARRRKVLVAELPGPFGNAARVRAGHRPPGPTFVRSSKTSAVDPGHDEPIRRRDDAPAESAPPAAASSPGRHHWFGHRAASG